MSRVPRRRPLQRHRTSASRPRSSSAWSAGRGAGFVLTNPLHAAAPVLPVEPSPYYPSSRRFTNPLYLRVEDLPEFSDAVPAVRARIGRLAEPVRALNRRDRLDRDRAWQAKLEALELLRTVPPSRKRRQAFRAFRAAGGQALEDFGTFCALAERHGPFWRDWPAELRHPRRAALGCSLGRSAHRPAGA